MKRRHFLRLAGAAALAPRTLGAAGTAPGATVLFEDSATALTNVRRDPSNKAALWVRKADLPRINKFEVKPQGACRDDICIPIPKDMMRDGYFNLTAFAGKVRESVVVDTDERVWSFGEIPLLRGGFLTSRAAPDFAVPDRRGRIVHLSDFRGKKVLLVTWASW